MRLTETHIHRLFDISVAIKGLHALIELAGGFLVLFVSQQFIVNMALYLTQDELSEDPNDALSNYLLDSAKQLSIGSQHFIGWYLLVHGAIKLVLVAGLLKEKLWAYPSAIAVFSLFAAYQIFEFIRGHSLWMLVLTVLDALIVVLTWHEYRYMKKTGRKPKWSGEAELG